MGKIEARTHGEVAGYFTLSTDKRGVIAEFPNLITNGGLDRMGAFADWLSWCQVGSGTTAPNVNDSALASRIAGTNTVFTSANGAQSSPPYYAWRRNTYRFAQGVATGNIGEVGVGWATTGSLFSRARVLDSGGDPTTISVQADETLDVTYEFRYYPKTTDDTGTVTLTGNIGGVYDWVMRASNVTTEWQITQGGTNQGFVGGATFRTGEIGAVTQSPAGTASALLAVTPASYSNGSYERAFTVTAGLAVANLSGGIRSLYLRVGIGTFQFRFGLQGTDATIPKTADDVLSIIVKHSWARRP